MIYRLLITPVAMTMLAAIIDRRVQQSARARIDGLAVEPAKQGKPLTADLAGYRSLRAAGQRYRIIYRVDKGTVTVVVVAMGIGKAGSKQDIYSLARKLLRSRLLEPPRK